VLTRQVAAGRPTIAARALDLQSGVDPFSLVFAYGRALIGASAYDPISGIALFALPPQAPKLKVGRTVATLVASDLQETKNVNTIGANVMPNTAFVGGRLLVVGHPTVAWLTPEARDCLGGRERLLVVASATRKIASVSFLDGARTIGKDRRGAAGLYAIDWSTRRIARGRHTLRAVVRDTSGAEATAALAVRACGKR
jgi:hypothetical protein